LDQGCGTGLYFDALAATGRIVVGLDRSADQLQIARGRSRQLVQADAAIRCQNCSTPSPTAA
jgi:predicted TPR repeat methyltransferase